jgi:hypothetical protein
MGLAERGNYQGGTGCLQKHELLDAARMGRDCKSEGGQDGRCGRHEWIMISFLRYWVRDSRARRGPVDSQRLH